MYSSLEMALSMKCFWLLLALFVLLKVTDGMKTSKQKIYIIMSTM